MNDPVVRFVKSTTAVKSGFIAAGFTVSVLAVIGSLLILLGT